MADSTDEPNLKRRRVIYPEKKEEVPKKVATVNDALKCFKGFELTRVLNQNSERKSVFVHGTFKHKKGDAVILLEKTPFREETLPEILSRGTSVDTLHTNDIYGTYECYPSARLNGVKATVIHPASQAHIEKYLSQKCYMVEETGEDYRKLTLPLIEKSVGLNIKWVYNILNHQAEVERIIYEDPDPETGFVIMPDIKWNQKQVTDLYCIGICMKKGIRSIRDLSTEHLPLLKNMLTKGEAAIEEKHGLKANQLRIYFHYQPSYYHLHVHYTNVHFDAPGIQAERAHLLKVVIHNIEMNPSYYQKATLQFVVREKTALKDVYAEAGKI